MISIEKVDTKDKEGVRKFVEFYYHLYQDCSQWVPPLHIDAYMPLNRQKHPFFSHSEADFFLTIRDGQVVGRICAAVNKPFNDYHHTRKAQFYFFDCLNEQEIANALFEVRSNWVRGVNYDFLHSRKLARQFR